MPCGGYTETKSVRLCAGKVADEGYFLARFIASGKSENVFVALIGAEPRKARTVKILRPEGLRVEIKGVDLAEKLMQRGLVLKF